METNRNTHFNMNKIEQADDVPTIDSTLYKRLVGSLMYFTATRPHVMYGVSSISIFMESPKDCHWKIRTRILRYIAGTTDCGLGYATSEENIFIGYIDSDFVGIIDDRKNISGYYFHLGTNLVSWTSKKHPICQFLDATLCH